ncbi:MAG TPA: hypothetical protein VHB79_23785 [Polyangiaceae bacterium]|nr:hypothetical protein [Polyangiaceae bacterium]
MTTRRSWLLLLALALAPVTACTGGTGSERFHFEARIRGTASTGDAYTFENESGWLVRLDRAQVTLGPVYLNVVPPLRDKSASIWDLLVKPAWADGASHLDSGRVVGEVLAQVSFDALSEQPVTFPALGTITQEEVRTADVWFYPEPGTPAEAKKLDTVALDIAGQATRGDAIVPFRGLLKLDDSWIANQTASTRGNTSLATIRQVRGIPASFFPDPGGFLEITFDVKRLLRGADFSNLQANKTDSAGVKLLIPGKAGDQVMTNLYQGLHEADGTYTVRWHSP